MPFANKKKHPNAHWDVFLAEQLEANSIRLPSSKGTCVVLNHHEACYSILSAGSIRIHPIQGEVIDIEITSGLVFVNNNEVLLNVNERGYVKQL